MKIQIFALLPDEEKEEAVWKCGIFLENYDEGDYMCDIYQLPEFYVAFSYDLNKNEKAEITVHVNADELPHLLKIGNIFA